MQRAPGWETRLITLLAREQAAPFAWGTHDCATLALAVVHAVMGVDIGLGLDPWTSRRSAFQTLRRAGCNSAQEFFARWLEEIPVASAHRGDLVCPVTSRDRLMSPAILTGAEAHSRNESGWVVMPRALARRAFRVG